MKIPKVETERLVLRSMATADAATVHRLAGDRRLAGTTASIPIPYKRSTVEDWIRGLQVDETSGRFTFAITLRGSDELIGVISIVVERERPIGNIDYWIGVPYWNNGYATEAATAIMRYGFDVLGLVEVQAIHLARNLASGRVLRKLGMEPVAPSIDLVRGELEPIERYRLRRLER